MRACPRGPRTRLVALLLSASLLALAVAPAPCAYTSALYCVPSAAEATVVVFSCENEIVAFDGNHSSLTNREFMFVAAATPGDGVHDNWLLPMCINGHYNEEFT